MPYWLTEIFRRTRRRHHLEAPQDDHAPPLRTAEERAQEQEAWEQARQRIQQRQAEKQRNDRQPPAER